MEPAIRKQFLSILGTLVLTTAMAQSTNNRPVPFKELQRNQFSDNFTGRDIKKKELEIAPFQVTLLNIAANQPSKEIKIRKKKRFDL